ncbi:MAG: thiamine pyrophosphate-dependent enzyme, partial [Acidimicrobiales bacterium]
VLVGARSPVSFFAYPGKPSDLVPAGCHVHHLGDETTDVEAALDILAGELGVTEQSCRHQQHEVPGLPDGALTAQSLAVVLGALLPEGAIVSDEGNTLGLFAPGATACSPPHDWLCLAGGAIGQGLPVAVGAATACPDRPVIAFEADGSALYTLQSWWTMARSGLDVTTVVLRNGSYAVLNMELQRVGAHAGGPAAKRMLDLTDPDLDFVALAAGMGVPGEKVDTADGFAVALRRALAAPGPRVIEAIVPSLV